MPFYDLVCKQGHKQYSLLLPVGERPPCPECGEATETLWETAAAVSPDEIPGGIEIRHGICNEDGTPRRYYSKSEMAREAARRGLANIVTHVTPPHTDKNPHTIRWDAAPSYITEEGEAERLRAWYEDEKRRTGSQGAAKTSAA